MSTNNFAGYNPPEPTPGLTIINLISAEAKTGGLHINYDIGIGPATGYAFIHYQQTGIWPLTWIISDSPAADAVYQHALDAVQASNPDIDSLEDVRGVAIAAELAYDSSGYIRVCRSYPHDRCVIPPAAIQVGTSSWASGSPDFIRASLIAQNSGLDVLLADTHEKHSPMVDWCAEQGITIQPMLFPVGDYRIPLHDTIVDRKSNLLELYENFVVPNKRQAYEMDAVLAASHKRRLVYVTATKPEDCVNRLADLRNWSAQIPGKATAADGEKLHYRLVQHKKFFPNVEFAFCDEKKFCRTIYNILQS